MRFGRRRASDYRQAFETRSRALEAATEPPPAPVPTPPPAAAVVPPPVPAPAPVLPPTGPVLFDADLVGRLRSDPVARAQGKAVLDALHELPTEDLVARGLATREAHALVEAQHRTGRMTADSARRSRDLEAGLGAVQRVLAARGERLPPVQRHPIQGKSNPGQGR